MKIKQISAFLLALIMVLSFAACANEEVTPTTTEPATTAPETTVPDTTVAEGGENVLNADITYLTLNLSGDGENILSLTAYPNEDGTYFVEYIGEVRKQATVDATVMEAIKGGVEASGLLALNGAEEYGEGPAFASFYMSLSDETYYSANYGGEIPEEFALNYTAMDILFQTLLAEVPEYVPQPLVQGEIAESDRAAIDGILEHMTLAMPDSYAISGIAMDEYFAYTMGLTNVENVQSGVQFSSMMMTSAYSLSIVTLADGAAIEDVTADFETSIDWTKWVCVQPDAACVAVKDNQALCLMGAGDDYSMSKTAIEAAGWTIVTTLENPNL